MFSDFFGALAAYFRAYSMIRDYRLGRYFIGPAIWSALILSALFGLMLYFLAVPLGTLVVGWLTWLPWDAVDRFLANHAVWVGGVLIGLLGVIVLKNLLMAVMSPFMSPLSERVEQILTGSDPDTTFSGKRVVYEFIRGLRLAVGNLIRELLWTLAWILLGLVPVVNLLSPVLIFLTQSFYAGFGNLDYTMERHLKRKASRQFIREHRGLALGNGIPFMLMLFIPVIGLMIAPPLATVAGTIASVKRLPSR
ncbi:MAG: EI24 domain-containing protein [Lewinellaceae bacterium]|nr:EI24 domain-containing protein [Lewinellaceae bacterium]HPR00216.1 EI24 domain-containing protein [Saprospiraceae bacterium]HQU55066.1 EI24 domain-containing protein [Saprospiraceae bacterium]